MKFKLITESFLIGLKINDLQYGAGESEYHEILINPSLSEINPNAKAIIDAEGNVYVDHPQLDQYNTHSHAIHNDIRKAMEKEHAFKSSPKLMVYKQNGNNWEIAGDDCNDIQNYMEFEAVKKEFKEKTGGNLRPDMFQKWMQG